MDEYKLLEKGVFESTKKFEKRLNEMCNQGWSAKSIASGQGGVIVLLQKVDKYDKY